MDINQAADTIEKFFEQYRQQNDRFQPTETRVLPSGDAMDAIKIWFNFGPDLDEAEADARAEEAVAALREAHAEVAEAFELRVKSDAM